MAGRYFFQKENNKDRMADRLHFCIDLLRFFLDTCMDNSDPQQCWSHLLLSPLFSFNFNANSIFLTLNTISVAQKRAGEAAALFEERCTLQ